MCILEIQVATPFDDWCRKRGILGCVCVELQYQPWPDYLGSRH